MELLPEDIEKVDLDPDGLDAAIIAATDYDHAGYEPGTILEHAIKAYILATTPKPEKTVVKPYEGGREWNPDLDWGLT